MRWKKSENFKKKLFNPNIKRKFLQNKKILKIRLKNFKKNLKKK